MLLVRLLLLFEKLLLFFMFLNLEIWGLEQIRAGYVRRIKDYILNKGWELGDCLQYPPRIMHRQSLMSLLPYPIPY